MGKQLLLRALQGQTTERPPYLMFLGCYGGKLIGVPADEYLRSGELIAQGVREAIRQYQPDGISVMFDLQVEAEALGCGLRWNSESSPAVVAHVLDRTPFAALPKLDADAGRIPEILSAMRRLNAEQHDVALYGLVTGPFTLALHLKGSSLLMAMHDEPEEVQELLRFCTQAARTMARLYIDAGCDVIASVDPMTSQISPRAFQQFVAPHATGLFAEIRARRAFSSFFVCGHAQRNVEVMCQCRPDNVCVDENIPLDFVKEVSQRYGVSFGGNLQLTVMLLMGTEEAVRRHVRETLALGGNVGYILAPGCDLPWGVPAANLRAVAEVAHDADRSNLSQRASDIARDTLIEQNEHAAESGNNIIVDVVTLASEASASSQYMLETVREMVACFENVVLVREHRIQENEVADFMLEIIVKNVPMICVDNEIAFTRMIPSRTQLIQAIQARMNERAASGI